MRVTRSWVLGGVVAAAWAVDAWRRGERLRSTHRILVDLLLNALTADDPLTARHSRRVADLSYALGCHLGLGRREMATLRVAALLHDLGKIDDRFWDVVHSRERLTPAQRVEIEAHPRQSARILEPLEALHPGISDIVGSHHERWDGEGYPRGLCGTEIPLAGRIISLADVFDALTQPRRYKDPLPTDQALQKIRDSAGRQFDPRLVSQLEAPAVLHAWAEVARRGLAEARDADTEMVADSRDRETVLAESS